MAFYYDKMYLGSNELSRAYIGDAIKWIEPYRFVYDETKVYIIELDDDLKRTRTHYVFDTVQEAKAYIYDQLSGFEYEIRIGELVTPSVDISEGYFSTRWTYGATDSRLRKLSIYGGITNILSNAFYNANSLVSVLLGNTVTSIGAYAFYFCDELNYIQLGTSLTSIANQAFNGCSSLTSINIPSSVTTIGSSGTFSQCTNLQTIYIDKPINSIPDAPWGAPNTTEIIWAGYDSTKIAVLELDQYYNDVGDPSYYETASDAINAIKNGSADMYGMYVGENCGVTTIPSGAFANSSKIGKFIQGSITTISDGAFYKASNLKYVELSDGLLSIGYGAFNSAPFEELTIPSTVTSFANGVIQSCPNLRSFTIPSCVTVIASSEFMSCQSLSEVIIPSSVTSIASNAFSGTTSLEEITIPSSVVEIGSGAFGGSSLTLITINKPENSITGAPWGANNATITWTG